MNSAPQQARVLIGSVLDQRYVVVEPLRTEACGVRFMAYDMLNMSHIEILVPPDDSGEFSGAGYVKADQPLKEDRSPERGLRWSKPPPTKTPKPERRPENFLVKKCGGLPIKPPPVYFPPQVIDPLSTVQLDESDLIAVGLVDGSLSIPSPGANIMTWGQLAAAERDEIKQDLRYLTQRRRMVLAALLGFALTSVFFLVFAFSGDPEQPSPAVTKPVASKQPQTAPALAPAPEKATKATKAKPAPAPEKDVAKPPAPKQAAEKPKQARSAPERSAVERPKARQVRRTKQVRRAKRARRAKRHKLKRRRRAASKRARRRRLASRTTVDADAILAVGRSRPRMLRGTVDPFGH
jgi:hypothetical protein